MKCRKVKYLEVMLRLFQFNWRLYQFRPLNIDQINQIWSHWKENRLIFKMRCRKVKYLEVKLGLFQLKWRWYWFSWRLSKLGSGNDRILQERLNPFTNKILPLAQKSVAIDSIGLTGAEQDSLGILLRFFLDWVESLRDSFKNSWHYESWIMDPECPR